MKVAKESRKQKRSHKRKHASKAKGNVSFSLTESSAIIVIILFGKTITTN